jgi:transposase-like protein
MPSRYRRDVARLKAEIVARVEAGESLRAIGAAPGLPGHQTVRKWALEDAGFAAELAVARSRAGSLELRYDEALAAAFLARARAGEQINALLREPGMPSRRAYRAWQATEAPFAAAVLALRQRRDRAIGEHGRARFRAWDPALGERIIAAVSEGATLEAALAGDPALPCKPTLRRWRREQPAFDAVLRMIFADWRGRRAVARDCIPQVAEDIVDQIVTGGTFASISREGGPSRTTLRRWVAARPDFAAEVAQACELRDDWFREQVAATAAMTPPGAVGEARRSVGPILRHMVRLRHRPGTVHRRRGKG